MKEIIEELRNSLRKNEAMLIKSSSNRFYLTGFKSSAGTVLITAQKAVFFVDFRYYEKAKQTVCSLDVVLQTSLLSQIKDFCCDNGIDTVYIETESVTVAQLEAYKKALEGIGISCDNRADYLLNELRSVKSQSEIGRIKEAQRLTDETFSYIISRPLKGRSEREVMLDMEFYMRKAGSEGVSFDFIVVSGKNSSLPHGVPTDKIIEQGDFVTMDFGAVVDGYHSDMTRTVAVGFVTDEQRAVYETVLKAQNAAINAAKSGIVCSEIDKISRDIIYESGYEGCFGHALGHSVGIDIHENPAFSPSCNAVLKPGMIITVEPGIYLENKFGVRIEDMIIVKEKGCEDITRSEKSLMIL